MYEFESTDFALSDKGIHLLRSRYNYKTILYEEIDKGTVKRTAEIKNVFPSLILGIILVAFALYQIKDVIRLFTDPNVSVIFIEAIVLPLLPVSVGFYLIYIATKKGPVLIIESNNEKHKLRLRDFIRSNKINDVTNYLEGKLTYRFTQ